MPTISIIVPVYNVEKYLTRCLDSILAQTFKNIEIILVDDCSPDKSGLICDNYAKKDERILVIHRKKNGGLSAARNTGLDAAKGEYIGFVDSDDWIAPDMFEYLFKLINQSNSDIAKIQCFFTDKETSIPYKKEKINFYKEKNILFNFLYTGMTDKNSPFSVYTNLYKKNLINKNRFLEGRINEDIAFNYQVLSNANTMIISNLIKYYYFQNINGGSLGGLKLKDFDLLYICEYITKLAENEKSEEIKNLIKIKYARSYFSLLAKIAFYGFSNDEIDKKEIISELTKKLRKYYSLLICSPMPLNRKLMMTAICININLLSMPLTVYKKIKISRNISV